MTGTTRTGHQDHAISMSESFTIDCPICDDVVEMSIDEYLDENPGVKRDVKRMQQVTGGDMSELMLSHNMEKMVVEYMKREHLMNNHHFMQLQSYYFARKIIEEGMWA